MTRAHFLLYLSLICCTSLSLQPLLTGKMPIQGRLRKQLRKTRIYIYCEAAPLGLFVCSACQTLTAFHLILVISDLPGNGGECIQNIKAVETTICSVDLFSSFDTLEFFLFFWVTFPLVFSYSLLSSTVMPISPSVCLPVCPSVCHLSFSCYARNVSSPRNLEIKPPR